MTFLPIRVGCRRAAFARAVGLSPWGSPATGLCETQERVSLRRRAPRSRLIQSGYRALGENAKWPERRRLATLRIRSYLGLFVGRVVYAKGYQTTR